MLRKLLTISIVCLGMAGASAHAGIYLEPYLGYAMGNSKTASTEYDVSGVAFGARAGYSILGLAFGAEYATGKMELDSTPKADITPSDVGAFVGYTFPILVRAYGTYFFKSKNKSEVSGNSTDYEGTGMKLGVGFTGLPFVVVNFEYITNEFDKADGSTLTNKVDVKLYQVSLSLPLDF